MLPLSELLAMTPTQFREYRETLSDQDRRDVTRMLTLNKKSRLKLSAVRDRIKQELKSQLKSAERKREYNKMRHRRIRVAGESTSVPGYSDDKKVDPKTVSIVRLIKEKLAEYDVKTKRLNSDIIAESLVELAKEGDYIAIVEVINRVDGKVIEKHELDARVPVSLIFAPAQPVEALPESKQHINIIDVKPKELLMSKEESNIV